MALDLPKLSPRAPIIGSGNRSFPAHPTFLEFLEKTRDALIAQEGTQDELIADLAQAILDIQTAQAAADAAQADADTAQTTATEAASDAADAATDAATALTTANAADGRVDDVLDGTESHTALNVGGTNVKPLLDKSDGSKFDDVTAVEQGLLTPSYVAFTAGSVSWSAESSEKTLQSVTITVVRGDVVVNASATVIMNDPTMAASNIGTMKLYRDGVEIVNAAVALYAVGSTGTWQYPPQYVLNWLDTPGPGTYDYDITFEPDMTLSGQINRRYLAALPLEG